jgi:cytochrome c2
MLINTILTVILIALVVLFAWLTRRAWRSKRAILKWLGVVLAGLLTLLLVIVTTLALIGLYKFYEPHNNPVANIQVDRTPARIARGEQLAHLCMGCHSPNEQLPLSGYNLLARFPLPPIGTLYAPNLTPSGNIKDWTDGQVIRAVREGVHKDGRSLLVMPSTELHNLSDDDVQSLVAYLRSQPAVGNPTPDNQLNLFGALFINLVNFRTAQPPVEHVTAPQPGTPEYGKYMVDVMSCRGCHGLQLQGRAQAGPGGPPAPNLTKLIPQWTEAQFMNFFNTGELPNGSTVPIITFLDGFKAPAMPWNEIRAATTDDELKAMYKYLHGLQPVEDPKQ